VALLAGAAAPLAACGSEPARGLPVTVAIPRTSQADLLAAGRVRVRMKLAGGGNVRVRAGVRDGHGAAWLGPGRKLLLFPDRWRTVGLPLDARGRGALASCPAGPLTVRVASIATYTGARTAARPLQLTAPGCRRFFSPSAFWNTPLAPSASLDAASAQVTDQLVRQVRAGFRSKLPPTINTDQYTPGLFVAKGGQSRVRVALDGPPSREPALRAAFAAVPVPPGARPAAGSDGELVVWQPATDTMWEFWRMRRTAAGWVASWGGRLQGVSRSPGVFLSPHANWGTSASSLSLAGGLILPQELAGGKIDHALALGVPAIRARQFALPAQRTDGRSRCRNAVPEGARFRVDPRVDIEALRLPAPVATLTRAAQRYGIVVREQSGAVAFYAQNVASLGRDPYPAAFGGMSPTQLLARFPWSRLQLVRMHLREQPGGPRLPLGLLGCL
jgi:hypothetical protein